MLKQSVQSNCSFKHCISRQINTWAICPLDYSNIMCKVGPPPLPLHSHPFKCCSALSDSWSDFEGIRNHARYMNFQFFCSSIQTCIQIFRLYYIIFVKIKWSLKRSKCSFLYFLSYLNCYKCNKCGPKAQAADCSKHNFRHFSTFGFVSFWWKHIFLIQAFKMRGVFFIRKWAELRRCPPTRDKISKVLKNESCKAAVVDCRSWTLA